MALARVNREHVIPQFLLRAWPFPRGSGRIIDHFFSSLSFEDQVSLVQTSDGVPMLVLPNDHIGRHIYLTGSFDRTTVDVLATLARPGDTLLDIGANVGYVSASFLTRIPGSRVIAVEPQPGIHDLLVRNLAQFGERGVAFPVAISDNPGIGRLKICAWNLGASALTDLEDKDTISVDLWTPKRLLSEAGADRVDLIKIDVEGHESAVLRGLAECIPQIAPRAIVFEDHTGKAAPDGEIGSLLQQLGYVVCGIRKRLTRIDLVPVRSAEDCRMPDYVAVRSDRSGGPESP